MSGRQPESLRLDRYRAVVVLKDGKKFTPLVGVNVGYARGHPDCYVNLLRVGTEGTIFGSEAHFSAHKGFAVWRLDRQNDLGYASLVTDLDSRSRPLAFACSIPREWFLDGFSRPWLRDIREQWLITPRRFGAGLHFEFAFWPAGHRPDEQAIAEYYEQLARGKAIKTFACSAVRNTVTLGLYEGGPDAELALDFQLDQPLISSSEGAVVSAETIVLGGPRQTKSGAPDLG